MPRRRLRKKPERPKKLLRKKRKKREESELKSFAKSSWRKAESCRKKEREKD